MDPILNFISENLPLWVILIACFFLLFQVTNTRSVPGADEDRFAQGIRNAVPIQGMLLGVLFTILALMIRFVDYMSS